MFNKILIILLLLASHKLKDAEVTNHWIIWNVGQGQWITHVTTEACLHFDVGGEIGTFSRIRKSLVKNCARKRNHILLSHWDLDHFIHVPHVRKTLPQLCWQSRPALPLKRKISAERIAALPIFYCTEQALTIQHWVPQSGKSANDFSIVHYQDGFLLPGDSTIAAEKKWSEELPSIKNTKVLIAGHHGSRTSTSSLLLSKLPNLQMTIVSARKARYGHPHKKVLTRLRNKKTPVLTTEDWGSIWIL